MDTPKEVSITSGAGDQNLPEARVTAAASDGNRSEPAANTEDVAPETPPTNRQRSSMPSDSQHSNSASSSWASNDDLRRQRKHEQRTRRGRRWSEIKNKRSPPRPGPIRRTKTPTTNNLSTTASGGGFFSEHDSLEGEDLTTSLLLPPTLILEGEGGREPNLSNPPFRGRSKPRTPTRKQPPTPQPPEKQHSSYRKWLAEGMLETLNVVAGITLSTTGTILSPPIAMTRNVLIPSLLAIIVDALDAVTPLRVQDWFRILSSSVYHLFELLVAGSTERGVRFRQQVTVVACSFLEAWSAPESRQVVVDGMATGVKLADALHTPEMKIFLDQLGVLGCRFVDAMASGKSKEFLQNSKDLVWASIELACDPSTTLALAEVTAHVCHALQEVDDSFDTKTPRAARNAHNEKTYLNSSLMTKDYPFESMEKIILSSLGMDGSDIDPTYSNESMNHSEGDIDDGMDHDSVEQSIPSNVAFRVEGGSNHPLEIPNLDHQQTPERKKADHTRSNWEKCKERVDVELLQQKILHEGRPRARPPIGNSSSNSTGARSDLLDFANREDPACQRSSMEDYAKIEEDMEELPLPESRNPPNSASHRNHPNMKELYEKFERMETRESEKPSYVQFFNAIDDLLKEKRIRKEDYLQSLVRDAEPGGDDANPQAGGNGNRESKARVRTLRNGMPRDGKPKSKVVRERYSNLRRLWKYPPSLLRLSAVLLLFVTVVWIGFGVYGMYTLFNHVVYPHQGISVPPTNQDSFHPSQQRYPHPPPMPEFDYARWMPPPNTPASNRQYDQEVKHQNPNEIVIRIVKEVVHVREDESRIAQHEKASEKNALGDDLGQKDEGVESNTVHVPLTQVTQIDDGITENSGDVEKKNPSGGEVNHRAQDTGDGIKESEDTNEENCEFGQEFLKDESSNKIVGDNENTELIGGDFSTEEMDRVKECVALSLAGEQHDGSAPDKDDSEGGDGFLKSTLSKEEKERVKECLGSYL